MECGDTERLIETYLDGELSPAAAEQVETHLAKCARCRQTHGGLFTLLRSQEAVAIPDGLRDRVLTEVKARAAGGSAAKSIRLKIERSRRRIRWSPWTGAVAASLMFLILGWFSSRLWVTLPEPVLPVVENVQQEQAQEQAMVVMSPWMLSGWAQAMALRGPANPLVFAVQATGMELLTTRSLDFAPPPGIRRALTSRPVLPAENRRPPALIPVFPPVFRL